MSELSDVVRVWLRDTLIAQLTYISRAWAGFTISEDKAHLQSVLKKGYWAAEVLTRDSWLDSSRDSSRIFVTRDLTRVADL